MKVPSKNLSRFLAKEDIAQPIVAIMDSIHLERLKGARGEEEKFILSFAGPIKPMVLNVLNRKAVIAIYGDESDNWKGRPIELYVDPTVTMGGDVVGGIRVRVPRPVAPVAPAKPPVNGAPRPQKVYTIEEKHAGVLRGYANAKDERMVQEVAAWADKHEWAQHHQEEQADAYNAALDRLGIGIDAEYGDIPF